jgi:hypothetical protein
VLFGDFLALASEQLETAAMDGAKLPAAGAHRAGWELSRNHCSDGTVRRRIRSA